MALLTTIEASKRLGVTVRRVRALIEAELLPAQKMGRDWFIEEADITKLKAKPRPRGRPKKSE